MWRGHLHTASDGDDESPASSYAASHSESQATTPLQSGEQKDGDDSYGDDDFAEYSDEFEADDDDGDTVSDHGKSAHSEPSGGPFRVGDRVQAYWDEEMEWFDGTVAHVEALRCFVIYTDGEEQWESAEIIRFAPSTTIQSTQQLQLHTNASFVVTGQRVIVYWHDESSWFEGSIDDTTVDGGVVQSIHVVYDDGDDQWITRAAFRDVLLVVSVAATQPIDSSLSEAVSVETGTKRYLTPRTYTPAVTAHFEPVRTARPYRCSVLNHVGSIITPRSAEERKRPFYAPTEVKLNVKVTSSRAISQLEGVTSMRECEVQTEIVIGPTSSA